MDVRDEQSLNAPYSIEVTLLGIVIDVRDEQPKNAEFPIEVRFSGRRILSKLLLPLKLTPEVFVIADKSTSTKEVISRIQVKSSSLSVPVTVSLVTTAAREPALMISWAKVPGVET